MYVLGNFVENKGFNSIWSIEKDVVHEEEKGRKRVADIWKLEAKILVDLEPIPESS